MLLHHRLAHLALHPHEIHHVILRIPQRGHEELIPEGGAVRLVIQETNGGVGPLPHPLSNDVDRRLIGPGSLEETAIPPQDLIEGVPREIEEALRHVHDGIVGEGRVGNSEVLLRPAERRHETVIGFHEGLDGSEPRGHGEGSVRPLLGLGGIVLVSLVFVIANVLEQVGGPVGELAFDDVLERVYLALQALYLLLEGFEEEFLSQSRSLGVFSIAFPSFYFLGFREGCGWFGGDGAERTAAGGGGGASVGASATAACIVDGGWDGRRFEFDGGGNGGGR
mmetsp:Transcript_32988/g.60820  ORF Transcript_32988/g.60820 Transcript_32988/m.60820 type:complete len:280 (-) Transcript_32988:14-853(-)